MCLASAPSRSGAPADIVLFDPQREWNVTPETIASKGKNTPVMGQTLRGVVVATVHGGSVVHEAEASYNSHTSLTSEETV